MPSRDLLPQFDRKLKLAHQWEWSGEHYAQTSEAWLENLDHHRKDVERIFKKIYGSESRRWVQRWRVFFMACAELFGYDHGQEWGVTHYLFENQR